MDRSMRILAVADIHGKPSHIEAIFSATDQYHPDLLVIAGDLTHFFNWKTCLAQLDSLRVPILSILGNTDFKRLAPYIDKAVNITALTPKPLQIKGFSFVGTDGALTLPFMSKICLKERERVRRFEGVGPETVMVVHPPPKGVLDRVGGKFSAGSRVLTDFIQTTKPLLVLCGHIHEQPGKAFLGQSLVVNCSMSPKSMGAVIDLKEGASPEVNLLQA